MVKGEPGVWKLGELKSLGLVDKGVRLISSKRGTKSLLLVMVSLEYFGKRNSPPLLMEVWQDGRSFMTVTKSAFSASQHGSHLMKRIV